MAGRARAVGGRLVSIGAFARTQPWVRGGPEVVGLTHDVWGQSTERGQCGTMWKLFVSGGVHRMENEIHEARAWPARPSFGRFVVMFIGRKMLG